MGTRQQELEASCELTLQLAKQRAGTLLPDVEYAESLILAAPELLEVCKEVLEHLPDSGCEGSWDAGSAALLRAAIARAEGKS